MNTPIELHRTLPYDVGTRNGRHLCHQTLTKPLKAREVEILKDVAAIINEAAFNGASAKEQLQLARLMGYVQAMATAIGLAEAFGITFSTTTTSEGSEGLAARIDYPTPVSMNPVTGTRN